ncbi:hypothetical protein [Actinomadura sp. GTD37]|uniref:hypothetical protein n=1 Tax=Actinomadura sp. GTD37 TaxID=1778030 RepID=UPI0035C0D024
MAPRSNRTPGALVASLESTLRLRHHKAGALTAMAEDLYRRTGGMIRSLSQLVRGAALLAIEDGTEHITREHLALVPLDYAAQTSSGAARRSAKAV